MRIRALTLTLAVLLALVLLLGLGGPAAAEKVLKVGTPKEPANLNPVLISEIYGESVACSLYDTLVSFKEDAASPAPLLAEKWEIEQEGKLYTFHLRKGVKFHNGDELKAADVVYTFQAIKDPENASPSKQFFDPVVKIEAPDDYTVRLTLEKPYAPLLLAIGTPTAGIIPAKVVKAMGMDKFDRAPVGTGAFKFVEWVPDDRIVLSKNPDYFLGAPKLDRVIYRPIPKPEVMASELQAGGLHIGSDLLPQDIDRLKKEGLKVLSTAGLSNTYIGFSAANAPFSDVRFRKAVYHCLPLEQIIKGIYRDTSEQAYSWIPVGVPGDDLAYMKGRTLTYDEAKAKELFDSLKKDGVLKEGFEFTIYCPQNPQRKKIAEAISTQLRKFGISARVETPEWASLLPILKKGGAGIYIMGWGSVPDPDRWTYKLFHPDSVWNFSRYNDPVVTEALEKGRVTVVPEARAALYAKAMRKALGEDYIHIPVVWKKTINVVSEKVKGFQPSPQQYIHLVTAKRNVDLAE
jgi:peptide/nickel transport system substrate-binding protein